MQPETHLEETPEQVRGQLSLSTITASGPTGNCPGVDPVSAKITALMAADPEVPIRRSATGCRETGRTCGRRKVEDEMTGDLSAIPTPGGTLHTTVPRTLACTASTRERAASRAEPRADGPDHAGLSLACRNLLAGSLTFLSESNARRVEPSQETTIRTPTARRPRGTTTAEPSPGWAARPEAWNHLRPPSTWTPKCLVRGCWKGTGPNRRR